ncbi:beta-N-acetylhexosaminidase [Acidipropionibacterium timonense]|uniref:beta-N-acetylhexosaminidase n=1 Tax=Acidipropionibacterium timonense TaxID=2161818 RepID=UPI001031B468|nr:beta-N-acetylhexosaminidase [Acidipropionibacterium timonense]
MPDVPTTSSALPSLLPTPSRVALTAGTTPLPTVLRWSGPLEVVDAVTVLTERLAPALDVVPAGDDPAFLSFDVDPSLPEEGYRIEICETVSVRAGSGQGARWAVQTLLQLLPAWVYGPGPLDVTTLVLPRGVVEDAPRYSWRGAHLDPCRNFLPAEFILRFLDVMAMHKLNRLHLHLTDDQGWRLPVPGYPLLTEIGAWRPGTVRGHQPPPDELDCDDVAEHDGIRHGGAYTVEQLRAIDARATVLGITVVPEVDLPGHTESVIAAYPELSCSTRVEHPRTCFGVSSHHINLTEPALDLCRAALDAVMEIFPDSPIHIGGDECPGTEWFEHEPTRQRLEELGITTTHEAQAWFEQQICAHVMGSGRRIVAWDEVLEAGAPQGVTVMVWRDAADVQRAADAGHDVIAAPVRHTYLDYASALGPNEPLAIGGPLTMDDVAGLAQVLAGVDSPHLLGGQFQLWGEYLRTPASVEYAAFPRGCSIADQLWTGEPARPESELAGQTARLTAMGVNWRR